MTPAEVNEIIKNHKVETNLVSDGYHTFGELYEHRIKLFIALCKSLERLYFKNLSDSVVWRSKKHADGSEMDGWFIMGINKEFGLQITYHLPNKFWDECSFCESLDESPEWDGHTSADVLKRLDIYTGNA